MDLQQDLSYDTLNLSYDTATLADARRQFDTMTIDELFTWRESQLDSIQNVIPFDPLIRAALRECIRRYQVMFNEVIAARGAAA